MLRPEVVLLEVAHTNLEDGRPVIIVEQFTEPDPSASMPLALEALVSQAEQTLQAALEAPGVLIHDARKIRRAPLFPGKGFPPRHPHRLLTQMTNLEASKTMSHLLRSRWGGDARMRELDSRVGSASVVIYDAAKVSLAPGEGDITVVSRSAIPLLPVPETELTVRSAAVVSVLADVDSEVRASLPARFLKAFDAWSTASEEISPPPHTPHD